MSIYIHIPFCSSICTYCDFCKLLKNEKWINQYLDALAQEIKKKYKKEKVKTIYIGGGTPSSLSLENLKKLFNILKIFNLDRQCEITFETNSEDLTIEKINFLKKHINRLSIGIQTFDKNIIKTLNRKLNIDNVKLAFKNFDNIKIVLISDFITKNFREIAVSIGVNLVIPTRC